MSIKAVNMVRKIRDRHYQETKDLSLEKQKEFIKAKSEKLQASYVASKRKATTKPK